MVTKALPWVLAVVVGIAAESVGSGWNDPGLALADLLTGWCLIACGLVARARRPASRTGLLLATAGCAWFVANLAAATAAVPAWIGSHALYLHRGPMFHATITYPRGRATTHLDRVAIAASYVAALISPLWRSQAASIALSAAFAGAAAISIVRAHGQERPRRLAAFYATGALSGVIATIAAVRLLDPTLEAQETTLVAYEVALCMLAVTMLVGLVREPWARARLGALVADMEGRRPGPLRDALARALGDPSLELYYRLPASGGYVDSAGQPAALPRNAEGRQLTYVERDGAEIAVLVHDSLALQDPGVATTVTSVVRLAVDNTRLQAEIQSQVSELDASRRRLITAGDEERRRLESRLRDGAERRLQELHGLLGRALEDADAREELVSSLERSRAQLAETTAELAALAAGLHPRALTEEGLAGGLAAMAARSPVPVTVRTEGALLPTELGVAVYYVCSEAITNAVKHASASRIMVSISSSDGILSVEIADDGVGGVDPSGSGLRGLHDRVAALGGTLEILSRPGGGTAVTAQFPVPRSFRD